MRTLDETTVSLGTVNHNVIVLENRLQGIKDRLRSIEAKQDIIIAHNDALITAQMSALASHGVTGGEAA